MGERHSGNGEHGSARLGPLLSRVRGHLPQGILAVWPRDRTEHVESTGLLRAVLLRSMIKSGGVVNCEYVGEGCGNFCLWETKKMNIGCRDETRDGCKRKLCENATEGMAKICK